MKNKTFFVGVNIAANELTEQIATKDNLPKNYEVTTTNPQGLNEMLHSAGKVNVKVFTIDGKLNGAELVDNDNELVVITNK